MQWDGQQGSVSNTERKREEEELLVASFTKALLERVKLGMGRW